MTKLLLQVTQESISVNLKDILLMTFDLCKINLGRQFPATVVTWSEMI